MVETQNYKKKLIYEKKSFKNIIFALSNRVWKWK